MVNKPLSEITRQHAKIAERNMGQGLSGAAGGFMDKMRGTFRGPAAAIGEVQGVTNALTKPVRGALWKGTKRMGIVAGVIGGVAALGIMARKMSNNRKYKPGRDDAGLDDLANQLPPVVTGQQMMAPGVMAQDSMSGPAEGRGATEWQQRVRPGAGQQQVLNPAINAEAQDLGNARGA